MLLFSKINDKKLCFIFSNAKTSNFVKLSRKQCVSISSWNVPKVFQERIWTIFIDPHSKACNALAHYGERYSSAVEIGLRDRGGAGGEREWDEIIKGKSI